MSQPHSLPEGVERYEIGEPEERGGPLRRYLETPMESDPQGDWVKFSDHAAALAACRSKVVGEVERPIRRELSHGGVADEISQVILILENEGKPVAARRLQEAHDEFRIRMEADLASLDSYTPNTAGLREAIQPALDTAQELAERVNQELDDYPAYSSAMDVIHDAEAALPSYTEQDDDPPPRFSVQQVRERFARATTDWPPASRHLVEGAITAAFPYTEQPEQEREPNADEWCCDSCGLIAPEESAGWEQTPQDDAGVSVERCPQCRLQPEQEDCERCGGYGKAKAREGDPGSLRYICEDCNGTGKKQPGQPEEGGGDA